MGVPQWAQGRLARPYTHTLAWADGSPRVVTRWGRPGVALSSSRRRAVEISARSLSSGSAATRVHGLTDSANRISLLKTLPIPASDSPSWTPEKV